METPKPAVSALRQRMIEDMRMRKLGDRTQEGYIRAVRYFTKYLGRSPRYRDSGGSAELSAVPG